MTPLCKCGCGKPVQLIKKGDRKRGIVAGTPRKFATRKCYDRHRTRTQGDACGRGHPYSYYPSGRKRCRICNAARKLAAETGLKLEDILEHPNHGHCDICKRVPSNKLWDCLQLDHDHQTGFIRGWLCGPCNKALGLFRDNVEVIREAYLYLELAKFAQEFVGVAG